MIFTGTGKISTQGGDQEVINQPSERAAVQVTPVMKYSSSYGPAVATDPEKSFYPV